MLPELGEALAASRTLHRLGDRDLDEFRRSYATQGDADDHVAIQDVQVGHGGRLATGHREGLIGFGAHQTTRLPIGGEETGDHAGDRGPGLGVVFLEDEVLQGLLDRLLDIDQVAAHLDIAVVVAVAIQGASPPDHRALSWQGPQDAN